MTAYVIPPVNAEAIGTGGSRFGITPEMLLYSSVPEAPPAAYDVGTTYALGAEVSTGTHGDVISVWRSKQDGNTGHPLVEGLWWTFAGETYAEWNPAQAYLQGHLVLRTSNHMVYRRVTAGTTAQPPEQDTQSVNWSLVGSTNRWAMFDMLSGTPTRAVGPVVVKLAPGRISGLGMLRVSDGTATLHMEAYGEDVWTPDPYPLDRTVINNWDDWWFAPFAPVSNIVRMDVPSYADGVLTITIAAGADFSLGWLVVGTAVPLGKVKSGAQLDTRSYTEVERNNYAEVTGINQQESVTVVGQTTYATKDLLMRAWDALEVAVGAPSVFVGLLDQQDEYAQLLTLLGLCMKKSMSLDDPNGSNIKVTIESV